MINVDEVTALIGVEVVAEDPAKFLAQPHGDRLGSGTGHSRTSTPVPASPPRVPFWPSLPPVPSLLRNAPSIYRVQMGDARQAPRVG